MSGEIERSRLSIGNKLADGGQGAVFELDDRPTEVYKQYHDPHRPEFRPDALRLLVSEAAQVTAAGERVSAWAAWPLAIVVDAGSVVGFTMPRVPGAFTIAVGGRTRLADLSFLASEPRPLWGNVALPSQEAKVGIVRHFAKVVDALHSRNLTFGDVSFNNILWSQSPMPRVMLLDCDGIAPDGKEPVTPRAETIDWDDPEDPDSHGSAVDRDRYKLACLALRVLTKSLDARPPTCPAVKTGNLDMDSRLARLTAAAAGPAGTRPTAGQWVAAMSERGQIEVEQPRGPRVFSAPPAQPDMLVGREPRKFTPLPRPEGP